MWMMWCVKVDHNTGVYVPYSFRTVVWVLLRPTRTDQWKCCETGPTVFRPYPRRLESLTICRCHYKGSTFFSVILKTLSVGPAGVRTRDLPLSRPALSQLSQPGGWDKFRRHVGVEQHQPKERKIKIDSYAKLVKQKPIRARNLVANISIDRNSPLQTLVLETLQSSRNLSKAYKNW